MKKTYSKPDIVFEDFSLSTSIASGCSYSTNLQQDICGVKFGGVIIYLQATLGCDQKVNENFLCYHNPTDDKNIFGGS